ncbi:sialidase family protein [Flavitalea sp. BT771]|uniref:WD40/YVTN/BNR-like repeat-containing protein n=1 Tax=Flavitalea sp. BT771 TaxID=3063329 RepID=UPI0026E11B3A|nr:sialidase family protein [Flavitalea sp. BT771]MDO6432034.1 sialidase family protein [Flavitalea sp. BT771]MDV6220943.1 sialidase family protein [Flavitalea sp. BT771]
MNRAIPAILVLCLFTACQKQDHDPQANVFFIKIDPSVGSLTSRGQGDTFFVSLVNPQMVAAVPLVYHLPAGAVVNSGKKQGMNVFSQDQVGNLWADTVDLTPSPMHILTVTWANGTTKQYAIAFKYETKFIGFPEVVRDAYTNSIFFDGETMYVATTKGLLMSQYDGFADYFLLGGVTGPGPEVNCVYARGKTIYAGINDGLAMSSDGGKTFTTRVYKSASGYGFGVTGIAVQGDTVYCASGNGMLISRDGGASFDTTTNGLITPGNTTQSMWCVYASGSTVYAGGQNGLFISHDGGRSFTYNDNLKDPSGLRIRVNGIYVQDGVLYLATIQGVAISKDGGQTFSNHQPNGVPWAGQVAVNGNTISVATGKLDITTDGGQSFTTYSGEIGLGKNVTSVATTGNVIYCGSQNSVLKIIPRE